MLTIHALLCCISNRRNSSKLYTNLYKEQTHIFFTMLKLMLRESIKKCNFISYNNMRFSN